MISGSAVSLPQEAKYFFSNDYLGERWLVQGPFWLHRYLARDSANGRPSASRSHLKDMGCGKQLVC